MNISRHPCPSTQPPAVVSQRPSRWLAAVLVVMLAMNAPAATVICTNLIDAIGTKAGVQRVTFTPWFSGPRVPQKYGNQTVLPQVVAANCDTNSAFAITILAGGLYDATFTPPNSYVQPVRILIPSNDTNRYTLNDVISMATNKNVFLWTNSVLIAPGTNIVFTTNGAQIVINATAGSSTLSGVIEGPTGTNTFSPAGSNQIAAIAATVTPSGAITNGQTGVSLSGHFTYTPTPNTNTIYITGAGYALGNGTYTYTGSTYTNLATGTYIYNNGLWNISDGTNDLYIEGAPPFPGNWRPGNAPAMPPAPTGTYATNNVALLGPSSYDGSLTTNLQSSNLVGQIPSTLLPSGLMVNGQTLTVTNVTLNVGETVYRWNNSLGRFTVGGTGSAIESFGMDGSYLDGGGFTLTNATAGELAGDYYWSDGAQAGQFSFTATETTPLAITYGSNTVFRVSAAGIVHANGAGVSNIPTANLVGTIQSSNVVGPIQSTNVVGPIQSTNLVGILPMGTLTTLPVVTNGFLTTDGTNRSYSRNLQYGTNVQDSALSTNIARLNQNAVWTSNGVATVTIGTNGAITSVGVIKATNSILADATGTTTSAPRIIGIYGSGAGLAGRIQFLDANNSLSCSVDGKMVLGSYWGAEICGDYQGNTPFVARSASDPALLIRGGTTASSVILVKTKDLSATLMDLKTNGNIFFSGVISPTNGHAFPPKTSSTTYTQLGTSNTVVFWGSNNIPQTVYASTYDVNSNRYDTAVAEFMPRWTDALAQASALAPGGSAPSARSLPGTWPDTYTPRGFSYDVDNWASFTIQTAHVFATTNGYFPNFYYEPHIHVSPNTSLATGTNVTFVMQWQVSDVYGTFTNSPVLCATNTVAFTNLAQHVILSFGNFTNNALAGKSSVEFRGGIRRTTAAISDIGNSASLSPFVDSVDFHVPIRKIGSTTQYSGE